MTKSEVINAMKQLGGIATKKDIERICGHNQQYVIMRMRKNKEIEMMFDEDTIGGEYVYILND